MFKLPVTRKPALNLMIEVQEGPVAAEGHRDGHAGASLVTIRVIKSRITASLPVELSVRG